MMVAERQQHLIERLPAVRGRYEADARLGRLTWFRVGGPADVLFTPADEADLRDFLAGCPADVPVALLGIGANVLIRDGGIRGVVVRLGRGFAQIAVEGTALNVGAGALNANVAKAARDHDVGGLEFLSGIPGTVGGGLRMNAGAYGAAFADIVVSATALDRDGNLRRFAVAELGYSYRHSDLDSGWTFVSAELRGMASERDAIVARMDEIMAQREASQPIRLRTGGSTFKNPQGHAAWELIDQAGCRGLRRGNAMVSEKHCNFLINTGRATAADLEALGEDVRRRVMETTGVLLDWEIQRVGEHDATIGEVRA